MWSILGFQGVRKPKFEKIAIFVWLSLMFSNDIETSADHFSGTTAIREVPLGVLDDPGFPLQKYIKIGKLGNATYKAIEPAPGRYVKVPC